MSVRALAFRASLIDADAKPLISELEGRSCSARDIADTVDRLAGALDEAGHERPRIGLWYANSIVAIEAFLAVEWLGGTRVPVDPTASAGEAESVFMAAGVDLVLTDSEHAQLSGDHCLVHDDGAELIGPRRLPRGEVDQDTPLMIYPRSVVNGRLFGIPLSYRNWYAIMDVSKRLFRSGRYGDWQGDCETYLTLQQIMHGTGFLGTFPFLEMGLPQVIARKFEIEKVLDAIEQHRITATMFVPAMLRAVLEAVADRPDAVGTLRHVLYGGGPVSGEEILQAVDTLGPVLNQVYGRVEGGWPLTLLDVNDHAAMKSRPHLLKSCGRPIADIDLELRSLPGEPEQVGELLVRSAMTSTDYVTPDGWCALGDVMRRDDEGYLYFERRLDRMINTGYHIYPDEIETALTALEGVASARVVGEPHPRWGEKVVAFVIPAEELPGPDFRSDLRVGLEKKLAKYKVPREFRIVKELPKI